ncbi:Lysophospholipase, alpha-beta hydrolase superfamily [Abditibacterium utsteinense]|uniref:Lysophospholipase, alpha-beta hydrolase superfamily n=1 Tax=Abditibacterium utsteinense TaxID=1960156 RepID=A0A2S8SW29_9BACT|nr:alpha/beta fold hydrolase [Abditibacterium utsteinense]PQV64979.1 Lysophospholipase, alpha-beta hydrolase superfamily [Abditibacterium utsteinense]
MIEHAVIFCNGRGEKLVGVYHEPAQKPRAAIVMFHGWSGTRCGPHQMLTRAARAFCARDFAVLRFDFAGRGDSDGNCELATLATMQQDARAAFDFLRQKTPAPLIVLGLCSGCEIVVAGVEADADVAGAILWSAPVFAAPPSQALAAKKRGVNLKKYARKLLSVATYTKILRGQIDTQSVSKALAGQGGSASKNLESNAPGQLPPGFRRACLEKWRQFAAPRLHIYGGADPITEESLQFYRETSGTEPEIALIAGANHSFYGLEWEREVFEITLEWLEARDFSNLIRSSNS